MASFELNELPTEDSTPDVDQSIQPLNPDSRMLHRMSIVIENTDATIHNDSRRLQLSTSRQTLPVQPQNALYNYKLFENRVATFPDDWKKKTGITSFEVAAQGFFYIDDDKLKCAYCTKTTSFKFITTHTIELLHRIVSPECEFLLMPFGPYLYYSILEGSFIYTNLNHCIQFLKLEGVKPNFSCTVPKFSTVESRLETINNWKNPVNIATRKALKFFKAGFYYNGDELYRLMCFSCGLTIRITENPSNPWFVHSKYNTSCSWLILKKGHRFINMARQIMREKCEPMNNNSDSLNQFIIYLEHNEKRYAFITNNESQLRLNSLTLKRNTEDHGQLRSFKNRIWTVNPKFMDEKLLCRICIKKRMEVVFVPCGHLLVCIQCSVSVNVCPMCRNSYQFAVRLFIFYAFDADTNDESVVSFPSSENLLLCKLCNQSEMEVALLPCKHVYCCFACAVDLKRCLFCGLKTIAYIRLYLP